MAEIQNFPWTTELDRLLFLSVQHVKPYEIKHLANDRWNQVIHHFFAQDALNHLRKEWFKPRDKDYTEWMLTRVRNHYKCLKTKYSNAVRLGKYSHEKGGECPPFYEVAKQIQKEIRDFKVERANAAEQKQAQATRAPKQDRSETTKGRKRKAVEVAASAEGSSASRPKKARAVKEKKAKSAEPPSNIEIETKFLMNKWIAANKKTIDSLLRECEINDVGGRLKSIGLKTLVGVFCTRGKKFDHDRFCNEMAKMNVDTVATNKVLACIEDWKRESELWATTNKKSKSSSR